MRAQDSDSWQISEDLPADVITLLYARDSLGLQNHTSALDPPQLVPNVPVVVGHPFSALAASTWQLMIRRQLWPESTESEIDRQLRQDILRNFGEQSSRWLGVVKRNNLKLLTSRSYLDGPRKLVMESFRTIGTSRLPRSFQIDIFVIPVAEDWWSADGLSVAMSLGVRSVSTKLAQAIASVLDNLRF